MSTATPSTASRDGLRLGAAFSALIRHPGVIFVLIALTALLAVSLLQVNSYDNIIHRRASWNVFITQRLPYDDPIEQARTLYFHPLHTAFLTAPFVIFSERPAAFWNVVFILIVLIGTRRGLPALATLLFALSPPLIFVIAAANMPGFTTALGLIFLLAQKRGPLRAYAWAMMAGRPQDNVLTLGWSALTALRQRDWAAFALGAGLMLPTILTLDHWLAITPRSVDQLAIVPNEFYSLSISVNSGLPAAIAFLALVIGWRLLDVRWERGAGQPARLSLRWRSARRLPLTEQFWLLNLIWLMLTPYYLVYMLWIMLLPLRLYGAGRTLALWLLVTMIGVASMTSLRPESVYLGGLAVTVVVALLTPKLESEPAGAVTPRSDRMSAVVMDDRKSALPQ